MKTSEIRVGGEYVWMERPQGQFARLFPSRPVRVVVREVKAHRVATTRVAGGTIPRKYGNPKTQWRDKPRVTHDGVRAEVVDPVTTGLGFSDHRAGEQVVLLPRDISGIWADHATEVERRQREEAELSARLDDADDADAAEYTKREAARVDVLVPVRAVLAEAGVPDDVIRDLADPDFTPVYVPAEALLNLAVRARQAG